MFGWFKKKQPPVGQLDARCNDILAKTVVLLEAQLMLCQADKDKYQDFIHSKFARGYFVGFFDAALQHASIPVNDGEHFILLVCVGHIYLFREDTAQAKRYALDSLALQDDEEFAKAQAQGGSEFFDLVGKENKKAYGLMRKFHSIGSANI